MERIFVIDNATKNILGQVNSIPVKGEVLLLRQYLFGYIEGVVDCVLSVPGKRTAFVFVDIADPVYGKHISDIV